MYKRQGRYSCFEDGPSDGRFINRPNYQKRYWKQSFFDAVDLIKEVCTKFDISIIEATYRWLAYHSMLENERGDAILIGASKLSHLKENLESIKSGSLQEEVLDVFERAWKICKADSPDYFRFYGQGVS